MILTLSQVTSLDEWVLQVLRRLGRVLTSKLLTRFGELEYATLFVVTIVFRAGTLTIQRCTANLEDKI